MVWPRLTNSSKRPSGYFEFSFGLAGLAIIVGWFFVYGSEQLAGSAVDPLEMVIVANVVLAGWFFMLLGILLGRLVSFLTETISRRLSK
jgi:hypothetical protein